MRYMRWSYLDLLACPEPYLDVIYDVSEKERSAVARARRR